MVVVKSKTQKKSCMIPKNLNKTFNLTWKILIGFPCI